MDPQACFREFFDGIIEGNPDKVHEYGMHLLNWLDRGGFMPEINGAEFSTILSVLLDGIESGGMLGEELSVDYLTS